MGDSRVHSVKCLNKSPGGKRFVFKSFSQRVEEIDINVFRRLDPVKVEPSAGSSFFRDALLEWRELNTAEDFISFYDEAMPLVQTLEQILLHKERLFSGLLQRLHVKARLSLEPILGLIVALSRDIIDQFTPFLSRLVDSIVHLLKSGGDHDPEILEQVFTSWSYLIMYLRKYLLDDITQVLKITRPLRSYPKDYVHEFMAEAVSFVMRNAPINQLEKGVKKVVKEASQDSSSERKTSASALLWYIIRGTSSTLHSKAEKVLWFLFSDSILGFQDNLCEGAEVAVVVVSNTLERLCNEIGTKELTVVWNLLIKRIKMACVHDGCVPSVKQLVSILTSVVRCCRNTTYEYQPIFETVNLLVESYIIPSPTIVADDLFPGLIDKILQLMLHLLDTPCFVNNPSFLSSIAEHWVPVFGLGSSSLLTFLKELVQKDPLIVTTFGSLLVSAIDHLLDSSPQEVLDIMVVLCGGCTGCFFPDYFSCVPMEKTSKICSFFEGKIGYWIKLIKNLTTEVCDSGMEALKSEVVVLWGVVRCYPLPCRKVESHLAVESLINNLTQLLDTETDSIAGLPKSTWQSILGESLTAFHKIIGNKISASEMSSLLQIARRNKSSAHILSSVANILDSVSGSKFQNFDMDLADDVVSKFSENLAHSNKAIRISTLRILSCFAPVGNYKLTSDDDRPCKKSNVEDSSTTDDLHFCNVIELLLSIESTPVSVSTSRKIIILISRIQMALNAGKVADGYLALLSFGIIGVFYNRFNQLWGPAMDCLAILFSNYRPAVWDDFIKYLENHQLRFLACKDQVETTNCLTPNGLGGRFDSFTSFDYDSTPQATVLGLLLQSLQKVPDVVESHSRQIIPLFLNYLGYPDNNSSSMESYNTYRCNRKEWRAVLTDWLELLKLMRNSCSLFRSQFLKDVLINRLLGEPDSSIQLKVLQCLLNWRDEYLLLYEQNLKNLIDLKTLREEFTTWNISKESQCIRKDHRGSVVPLIIRILVPKVRKMKMLASHKHAGATRKTILRFLAQLDVSEIPLFFSQLMKPLFSKKYQFEVPDKPLELYQPSVNCFSAVDISSISWKKRSGFLHVVKEILRTFDESRLRPFLNVLLMIVVCILESCSSSIDSAKGCENSAYVGNPVSKDGQENSNPAGSAPLFKSFSQRVEEIDINVFRRLDPVKVEPSAGSSFFRDALLEWRELNTAEDFISFYDEAMPLVQTLEQILLHKERLFSGLLQRLHVKARLSLEPILGLIVALSRDIIDQFTPFLSRLVDSIVHLLKSGGDHDPEILEQVFTSWSYLIMYLRKYLLDDITQVLKITRPLRSYPKDYVHEFMAEAVSFVMRNAPINQLEKGVKKVVKEASQDSSSERKTSASALLWYIIRGTSSTLHSKAEKVLWFLFSDSILGFQDNLCEGAEVAVVVVSNTLERLCNEIGTKELTVVWNLLIKRIKMACVHDGCVPSVKQLVSILTSVVRCCRNTTYEYQPIFETVNLLVESYIIPSPTIVADDLFPGLIDKILQLMLHLLDTPCFVNNPSFLSSIAEHWVPVFGLGSSSLLTFLKELVQKDPLIVTTFGSLLVSAIDHLLDSSPQEVLDIMVVLCGGCTGCFFPDYFSCVPMEKTSKICSFFEGKIGYWIKLIKNLTTEVCDSGMEALKSEVVVLWGVVRCYPLPCRKVESHLAVESLINNLTQLLDTETDSIAGLPKSTWQSILGESLTAFHKIIGNKISASEMSSLLQIARRNKSSAHILSSVANILDSVSGSKFQNFDMDLADDVVSKFSENLAHSNKAIRISTLRILSCFAPVGNYKLTSDDDRPCKKSNVEDSSTTDDLHFCNVIELLLSIESTPVSVSTSRKIIILISRIQMALNAGKVADGYLALLSFGIIGVFYNRFNQLWGPAMDCLAILFSNYRPAVWDDFIKYLENHQLRFLACKDQVETTNCLTPNGLGGRFDSFTSFDYDSTPQATVLGLLLQSLQKVPDVVESHSRQIIPLFLNYLGYPDNNSSSMESYNTYRCNRKEWRAVLTDWLELLKLMRNSCSLFRSQFLKDVLINRLLGEPDSSIQLKVLQCLLNWRDEYLLLYEQNLKNLIDLKTLREEFTTWNISKESQCIRKDHRGSVVPLIIRILVPKVRKMKMLASHKHAGATRKTILRFLAQLDVSEIPLFFSQLMKPLFSKKYQFEVPDKPLELYQPSVNCFSAVDISSISWKKRSGFLHVVKEILRTFDESRLRPFLNVLLMIVVCILESCSSSIDSAKGCENSAYVGNPVSKDGQENSNPAGSAPLGFTSIKQLKELRSLTLKIISYALDKYDDFSLQIEFWKVFFKSVKPLIDSFKQEVSSSAKPSSLLSCFVAMSRSPNFVTLLDMEATLVPTIFSILSVQTASNAVISSVLSFIENLLILDIELDQGEYNSVKKVLLPHIDVLICCFRQLFECRKDSCRKSLIGPGNTEIRIMKLLAKYVNEPLAATQFADIVLPLLKKKSLSYDACTEVLNVIMDIIPVMDNIAIQKVLNRIHYPLLSAVLGIRLSICDILDGLAVTAKDALFKDSLSLLAKLLRDLNATSASTLGEIDYDKRIKAYDMLKPEIFRDLNDDQTLIILSHCVYDMSSEDLILRQCASSSLFSFIQFAAGFCNNETVYCTKPLSDDLFSKEINSSYRTPNWGTWTKSCILKIIKKFIMQNMRAAMGKETYVQKEWVAVLREIIIKLPGMSTFSSLTPLCSEDLETDFFENILHLQVHKRAMALLRFRNVVNSGNCTEAIMVKIFVPLFFNMMFDVKDGKGEHLRNEFLESLACISGKMQWEGYLHFLMKCFSEMTAMPMKQKLLLRLICFVFDKFHFFNLDSLQKDNTSNALCSFTGETKEGDRLYHYYFASDIPEEKRSVPVKIQESLQKMVLPQILKLLHSDSEKINVNINIVALKLLKLLSLESMELHLSNIVHRVSNFLKNRLESTRDEARSVLVMCLKELGLSYLQFIVKVLQATLRRGYEVHVLGYTLNFILAKCLPSPTTGSLDYCLDDLVSIAVNDILGDVAGEKDVDKIASKMKETKKRMSFDTLRLISQNISFRTQALKMLDPIKAHLQKHVTAKAKVKIANMLHHVASGIKMNPSVERRELLVLVYGLIHDGILVDNPKGRDSFMTKTSNNSTQEMIESVSVSDNVLSGRRCTNLVTVFALDLLYNCLKGMKLRKEEEHFLSMFDPFIALLVDCLESKYEDILSATFKCLCILLRFPLPSISIYADEIKTILLDVVQKSSNASCLVAQSCLRLLSVLLTRISLSNDQLHMLIQFPLFIDLQTNPSPVALSLLKQIVTQKLEVPELYDVVFRAEELMVTSQSEPIRKKCSHLLLKFLLDYPLSKKCREQHLIFLLTNLSYEHPSGREAVLEMLHAIMVKFPKREIHNHARPIFLHLVVSLANERDSRIQSMIVTVLKLLIQCSSKNELHQMLEYSLSWYTGEKQHLWGAAAQVLGLLVEVSKEVFEGHTYDILRVVKNIMETSLHAAANKDPEHSKNSAVSFWKEAFYSLVMLEKALLQYPELYLDDNAEDLWDALCKLLLHPHVQLRNMSNHLVELYFRAASDGSTLDSGKLGHKSPLMKSSRLFKIAVSFCSQLKAQKVDDVTGSMIVHNLVYCICGLHFFASKRMHMSLYEFWASLCSDEQNCYLESFDLLGSRKHRNSFLLLSTGEANREMNVTESLLSDGVQKLQSLLVVSLLKKLGKIAVFQNGEQMKVVFNCYKLIILQIGCEGCYEYVLHILEPLYKVCEGLSGKVVSDELKHLAEDVRDCVRRLVGADYFVQVYNTIRKSLKDKREKRKRDEKLVAVIDPLRSAKRKMRISAKHRAHKKRKIMGLKMDRWRR